MSDQNLKLREKTIVICGPLNGITQALLSRLTELGADVALLTDKIDAAQRFCRNIMDLREVSEKFGRAAAVTPTATNVEEAASDISKAAELFGSIDAIVDCHFTSLQLTDSHSTSDINEIHHKSLIYSEAGLKFLNGRKKGRSVILSHKLDQRIMLEHHSEKTPQTILKHVSEQVETKTVSVNLVSLGYTEEFLLAHNKGLSIQKALEAIKSENPKAILIENTDVANTVSFLVSPLSQGIHKQDITLDYGSL